MPTTHPIEPTNSALDARSSPERPTTLDVDRNQHRATELVAFGMAELARLLGGHAPRRDLARRRQLGLGTLEVALILGAQTIALIIWLLLSRRWVG